ncbi:MAG: hypothetical protein WDW36_008282 [Sanguina aurantia]
MRVARLAAVGAPMAKRAATCCAARLRATRRARAPHARAMTARGSRPRWRAARRVLARCGARATRARMRDGDRSRDRSAARCSTKNIEPHARRSRRSTRARRDARDRATRARRCRRRADHSRARAGAPRCAGALRRASARAAALSGARSLRRDAMPVRRSRARRAARARTRIGAPAASALLHAPRRPAGSGAMRMLVARAIAVFAHQPRHHQRAATPRQRPPRAARSAWSMKNVLRSRRCARACARRRRGGPLIDARRSAKVRAQPRARARSRAERAIAPPPRADRPPRGSPGSALRSPIAAVAQIAGADGAPRAIATRAARRGGDRARQRAARASARGRSRGVAHRWEDRASAARAWRRDRALTRRRRGACEMPCR